jgi:diketogulonate reductase-like aldo/keto reductase
MMKERDAGRTRMLGVSNVSLKHLEQMTARHAEPPTFVQNRCYARYGWDREVRLFCRERGIVYQGFSLLTANRDVWRSAIVADIAAKHGGTHPITPAQVIFRFAKSIGILPMTGTSDASHMKQDLASLDFAIAQEVLDSIG